MENFKKIAVFFLLFLAVIGAGFALGRTGYHHEWVAFAGVLVLIGFAVPTWWKLLKEYLLK